MVVILLDNSIECLEYSGHKGQILK